MVRPYGANPAYFNAIGPYGRTIPVRLAELQYEVLRDR